MMVKEIRQSMLGVWPAELGVGLLNAEERVEMRREEHSGFKYQLEAQLLTFNS